MSRSRTLPLHTHCSFYRDLSIPHETLATEYLTPAFHALSKITPLGDEEPLFEAFNKSPEKGEYQVSDKILVSWVHQMIGDPPKLTMTIEVFDNRDDIDWEAVDRITA